MGPFVASALPCRAALGPFSRRFAEGYNAEWVLEAGWLGANTRASELHKCPVKDGLCSEMN